MREEHGGREPEGLRPVADFEFWLWVDAQLEYEEGLVAKAHAWTTYRHYRLPPGMSTEEAYGFYAQHPRGWNPRIERSGKCGSGPRWSCYALAFDRDEHCVSVSIGHALGSPVEPSRSLIVAADSVKLDPGGTC